MQRPSCLVWASPDLTGSGTRAISKARSLVRARVGQLSDRLVYLTTRYGSDAAAWQHEIHALAALEEADAKAALERFHALKRRLAEFRRAQLLRELRAFPFVADVPPSDAKGYTIREIETEIRDATRALAHARRIERALREIDEARATLVHRALPVAPTDAATPWDALAALADATERRRRAAMREGKLDERLRKAGSRARKLRVGDLPDAGLPSDELDTALTALEARIDHAERLADAHAKAIAPLKTPEVATYKHGSRRKLEHEANALRDAGDINGLAALAARSDQLRRDAAAMASQGARSRRRGIAAPEGERRPGDGVDPYG